MRSRLRAVAALVALLLIAAACGSDDTTDTETADASSASSEAAAAEEPTDDDAEESDDEATTEDSAEEAPAEDEADEAMAGNDDHDDHDHEEGEEHDDAMADADATADDAAAEEAAATEGECSGTYTFDSYSGPVEIPRNPETIAVYDMGMLTSFAELGIPLDSADGVATLGGSMPDDVEALVDGMTSLGSVFEPDLEALNALEPDLIVLASRSSGFFADFVELDIAPVVDLTSFDDWLPAPGEEAPVDFFEEFARTHRHIGEIFCVQDEVEAVIADIEGTIAEVQAAAPTAGDALVLVTTGSEVGAFGPGAFRFGQVYDIYGFTAADDSIAENETHGEAVSFEFIADAAPDILFVVDRAAATGEEGQAAAAILDNALVNTTPAAQNDKIIYVDPYNWYIVFNGIPGVRGVAEELAAAVG